MARMNHAVWRRLSHRIAKSIARSPHKGAPGSVHTMNSIVTSALIVKKKTMTLHCSNSGHKGFLCERFETFECPVNV